MNGMPYNIMSKAQEITDDREGGVLDDSCIFNGRHVHDRSADRGIRFQSRWRKKHRTVSPSHVLKGLHLIQCRAQQVLRACLDGEAYANLERKVDASIEPGTAAVDVPQ